MKTDDDENYYYYPANQKIKIDGIADRIWNYGKQVPCNLEGRYVHVVANLTELAKTNTNYQMSLCNYGIMGTKYVRDEPVVGFVEIQEGETSVLTIPHIKSFYEIGTQLSINLRQPEDDQLEFAQLTNDELEETTEVLINTQSLELGSYWLTLESYNENSDVQSALKTDLIEVRVICEWIPVKVLPLVLISATESSSWSMPVIHECSDDPIESISAKVGPNFEQFVWLNQTTALFTFQASDKSQQLEGSMMSFKIMVTTMSGLKEELTQIISFEKKEEVEEPEALAAYNFTFTLPEPEPEPQNITVTLPEERS